MELNNYSRDRFGKFSKDVLHDIHDRLSSFHFLKNICLSLISLLNLFVDLLPFTSSPVLLIEEVSEIAS